MIIEIACIVSTVILLALIVTEMRAYKDLSDHKSTSVSIDEATDIMTRILIKKKHVRMNSLFPLHVNVIQKCSTSITLEPMDIDLTNDWGHLTMLLKNGFVNTMNTSNDFLSSVNFTYVDTHEHVAHLEFDKNEDFNKRLTLGKHVLIFSWMDLEES